MQEKKILATVGNQTIYDEDIDFFMKSLDNQTALRFNNEEGRKKILAEIINHELLYSDAIQNELDKDEAFLVEVERFKKNILKQHAINKIFSDIKITDSEIADYYEQNKSGFATMEEVRAKHILVDDIETIEEVQKDLADGMPFEDAANEYSKCPSNVNGGDLGFFSKGRMVPEFEEAAFKLNIDEVSEPIKTQFGYHLIKVVDKKEAKTKSFDEVKSQIAQQLMQIKQENAYYNKINELKEKYEIKVNA